MRYSKRIPKNISAESYLSKKAGSFSGTPQSTVQVWTEKGLISAEVSDTTGTGKRRLYSPLNVIEIGIIRELSERRISHKAITEVMSFLHRNEETTKVTAAHGIKYEYSRLGSESSNLQKLLDAETGYIFILFLKDGQIEIKGQGISSGETWVGAYYDGKEVGADVQALFYYFMPPLADYDLGDLEHITLFPIDADCISWTTVNITTIAEDLIIQMH